MVKTARSPDVIVSFFAATYERLVIVKEIISL